MLSSRISYGVLGILLRALFELIGYAWVADVADVYPHYDPFDSRHELALNLACYEVKPLNRLLVLLLSFCLTIL